MKFDNRVTRMTGVELPIVQAPMGWIARSQLASAVSNAGGLGIIETSSGELDNIRSEIERKRPIFCKMDKRQIARFLRYQKYHLARRRFLRIKCFPLKKTLGFRLVSGPIDVIAILHQDCQTRKVGFKWLERPGGPDPQSL